MKVVEIITQELTQIYPKVALTIERVNKLPLIPQRDKFKKIRREDTGALCYWVPWSKQISAFVSLDGIKIHVLLTKDVANADIPKAILGFTSVLTGVCLNLQGKVAIHANAVSLNGLACAFTGYSGKGKSTLSAYCAERGAGFITDDVLAIEDGASAVPGSPRLKLYPHTSASLGLQETQTTNYKIFYDLKQWQVKFHTVPVPLGIIYLLAEDKNIYSEEVSPSQAVFELLTHSYYANELIADNPSVFNAYINLVSKFPVRKLFYPREFELLPEVYDFLMTEIEEL